MYPSTSAPEQTDVPAPKPERIKVSLQHEPSHLRRLITYLYLVRFSILLWLALPGLLLLDFAVPSLAHGLFALERPFHFFYVGFYVTLAGCVALLTARVTCAYGEQRFGMRPPDEFAVNQDMSWRTFLLSQTPGAILLIAICWISIDEAGVLEITPDALAMIGGIFLALALWAIVSAFHYWTHHVPEEGTADPWTDPTAFLLPGIGQCRIFQELRKAQPPLFTYILNSFFMFMAEVGGAGYADITRVRKLDKNRYAYSVARKLSKVNPEGLQGDQLPLLLPGHALNSILVFMSLLIYLGWLPFTAPVPLPKATQIIATAFAVFAFIWILLLRIQSQEAGPRKRFGVSERVLEYAMPCVLFLYVPASYALLHDIRPFREVWHRAIPALPSLGPVLMLLVLGFWALTGLSFLLDRFRIPVLPSVAIALLALHLVVAVGGIGHRALSARAAEHPSLRVPAAIAAFLLPNPKDHFFNFACPPGLCAVPPSAEDVVTPAQVLAAHIDPSHPHPLIVVTATGGGIHAAAWTAEVLASLEHAFAEKHQNFHGSILLLSTVSGGSVGSVPFVRGYFDPKIHAEMANSTWVNQPQEPPDTRSPLYRALFGLSEAEEKQRSAPQFITSATTSSLEAVSWGVVYPDFFRLLLPSRAFLGIPLEDYDRGWSLHRRMAVNMDVEDCPSINKWIPAGTKFPSGISATSNNRTSTQCLTLRELARSAGAGQSPAISFNTTTAENGSRFLLANYRVPPLVDSPFPFLRAESFLHDYGSSPYVLAGRTDVFFPDLELLSAARLSATFPYVSPMPRLPRVVQQGNKEEVFSNSLHFADGGYFDNDGTASAIEFLYQAFESYSKDKKDKTTAPVPILWIEIRDNNDFKEGVNPDQCTSQITSGNCSDQKDGEAPLGAKPHAPPSQGSAPLLTFWKAGHMSVSVRNHREMAILERAFDNQFFVRHREFTFELPSAQEAQPLSWHLTGRQKRDLVDQIRAKSTKSQISDTATWFATCAETISKTGPLNNQELCPLSAH